MARHSISKYFLAGILALCLIAPSIRAEEEEVQQQEDMYQQLAKNYQEQQQRLYFEGDNFTVNLIPLVICGVILALMCVGAFLIIDLLLNNDDDTGYGTSTGYGVPTTGYSAPAESYGAPAASYGAPAQSYGAAAPSYGAPAAAAAPSYGAPSSSYGYLKRTLNTANRIEKAVDEAEQLYK